MEEKEAGIGKGGGDCKGNSGFSNASNLVHFIIRDR